MSTVRSLLSPQELLGLSREGDLLFIEYFNSLLMAFGNAKEDDSVSVAAWVLDGTAGAHESAASMAPSDQASGGSDSVRA
jgi:hypothetical protein